MPAGTQLDGWTQPRWAVLSDKSVDADRAGNGRAIGEQPQEYIEYVLVDDEEQDEHGDRSAGHKGEDSRHGDDRLLHSCSDSTLSDRARRQ